MVVKDERPFFPNISIRRFLSQKFQFMQIVSNLNICAQNEIERDCHTLFLVDYEMLMDLL